MTLDERLAALVEEVSGNVLGERDVARLGRIARERAQANGFTDLSSYIDVLRKAPSGTEWREILGQITVNESSLFRGAKQFAALADTIVPQQIADGRTSIRVWSAGCARGEEPATIAVVLAACEALSGLNWSILATDVDEEALEIAATATFPKRAIRRVPPQYLQRYFESRGERYRLVAPLRKRIVFRHLNLVRSPLSVPGGPFDAIFLRNVLIYFRRDSQAQVVASIVPHLTRGGVLFVGPSESLRQLAPQCVARDFEGCFAYGVPAGIDGAAQPGDGTTRKSGAAAERVQGEKSVPHSVGASAVIAALERGDDAAAKALLSASPLQPDDPLSHVVKGVVAERAGRLDDAVRAYRAATYLDHSLYQVRFMMARCLVVSGWSDRAHGEYRALDDMLRSGKGNALPWADRLGLPNRDEISMACRKAISGGSD